VNKEYSEKKRSLIGKQNLLLKLKYHNPIADAVVKLGTPSELHKVFAGFQKHPYQQLFPMHMSALGIKSKNCQYESLLPQKSEDMSATKQWNLFTMNGQDGNPLSFDQNLGALIALLRKLDSMDIAQTLSEISGILYDNDGIEANVILTKKYASLSDSFLPVINNDGSGNILFTQNAVWILNSLLTFEPLNAPEDQPELIPCMVFPKESVVSPTVELFLLTNQLIVHIQNSISEYTEAFPSKTQLYFSYHRIDEDAVAAIGKAENLFNTDYFNKKLNETLEMSVKQLSNYLFILLALVLVRRPAKIEPDVSFRRIIQETDRKKIAKLLELLSINMNSIGATQPQIAKALRHDFPLDEICRGKPFLKIGHRYLCLRPDLLISALSNFPYFYLLSTLPEGQKDELFNEFGLAFEKYVADISKRAVGERSHEYFKKNNMVAIDLEIYISPLVTRQGLLSK
jgi:hypothetical protein